MTSLDAITVKVEAATGNVEPLLHEIRHALQRVAEGREGTVIDLRRLPLAPGEEERIESVLGKGEVRAELDAIGPTVVQETSYAGVWLVTHRNTEHAVVARFIEVTRMPEILQAQLADIESGISRLDGELAAINEDTDPPRQDAAVQEATGTG
jgi:hydrogenase-1 operon protein HyaF